MSAYALFPPIQHSSASSSKDTAIASIGNNDSLKPTPSIVNSSVGCFITQHLECTDTSNAKDNHVNFMEIVGESDCSSQREIAVKEAKIDPVRLVQALTGGTALSSLSPRQHSPPTQGKTLRRRRSSDNLVRGDVTPQSSNLSASSRSSMFSIGETKKSQVVGGRSPHDHAIQFELSISLNGRKYTATRTLECIIQLRNDLIREMKYRRQWLINENNNNNRMRSLHHQEVKTSSASNHVGLDATDQQEDDTMEHIQIPEIPPMTTHDETRGSSGGFMGRGFTMLHAILSMYRPVMEVWLRNIIAVVPQDSECLMNFLWEPLSKEEVHVEFAHSCPNLTRLGSIKEFDTMAEEELEDQSTESDDEWFG